jgi:hypothetical protein
MAKRMRIITNDEYERLQLKPSNPHQVSENFFHKTNKNASSILDAKDIPDENKLQLYGSVMTAVKHQLHEILNKPVNVSLSINKSVDTDALRNLNSSLSSTPGGSPFQTPLTSPEKFDSPFHGLIKNPTELTTTDTSLLNTVPDKFKTKTYGLLKILKRFKEFIDWDDTGRVTFFENEFVPNSNLVDLLTYALRDIKFAHPPAGVNRFLRVLKVINVPHNILSKEARKGFLGDLDQMPVREGTTSRVSGFHNWNPIRSADRLTSQTPISSRSSSHNVTFRKRKP